MKRKYAHILYIVFLKLTVSITHFESLQGIIYACKDCLDSCNAM